MVPSGLTPLGMGAGVPITTPCGVVNQNDTASPGVKPVAVKTTVMPAVAVLGCAPPFTLPDTSQAAAAGVTQASTPSSAMPNPSARSFSFSTISFLLG